MKPYRREGEEEEEEAMLKLDEPSFQQRRRQSIPVYPDTTTIHIYPH